MDFLEKSQSKDHAFFEHLAEKDAERNLCLIALRKLQKFSKETIKQENSGQSHVFVHHVHIFFNAFIVTVNPFPEIITTLFVLICNSITILQFNS